MVQSELITYMYIIYFLYYLYDLFIIYHHLYVLHMTLSNCLSVKFNAILFDVYIKSQNTRFFHSKRSGCASSVFKVNNQQFLVFSAMHNVWLCISLAG